MLQSATDTTSADNSGLCAWSLNDCKNTSLHQVWQPYQREASHPLALEQQQYALRPWEAVKLACSRQLALRLGDKTMIKGRAVQVGGLAGGTRQLMAARDSQPALRCRPSPMPDWARWLPWHDCGCWQPGVADGSR